ncbi:hypothetical protein RFI_20555 [Reticulomyxa filosa]|uniref:Uncharacterized protein n=1 Tax=Reticulomyxa filosa TaxID=46433 RepID=X6MTK4_RETFI|nr:hypothetical protein RFI_20555 [Reticulomyxa filosa]|eukprot:ETO16787.1 hypothetical protein RFI_20555 [Reticulomyxa filosa]
MSKVRSFIAGIFVRGNEKEKPLLTSPEGNLFHSLLLTYIRIFVQLQELEKQQSINKEKLQLKQNETCVCVCFFFATTQKKKKKQTPTTEQSPSPASTAPPNSNTNTSSNSYANISTEHDPLAVLQQIMNVVPKISSKQMEEDCVRQDLLQFLKIVSHQFTSHVISNEEQNHIHFRDPHLITPTRLNNPDLTQSNSTVTVAHAETNAAFSSLLHITNVPKFNPSFFFFFFGYLCFEFFYCNQS